MSKNIGKNKKNLEKTHALFLDLAKKEFSDHGYANASTTRIVEASGMARGSLYYHFKDKQDLFRAVYDNVMGDIANSLQKEISKTDDPWDGFIMAARLYFDICADPKKSRIFLIESQAALHYAERHDIISRTIRPVLTNTIAALAKEGYFDGRNKEMLSIFIFGALGESGRIINVLPNRDMVEKQFFETFEWAMQKLR